MDEYYIIQTIKHANNNLNKKISYYISITNDENNSSSKSIKFGSSSKKRSCVEIIVYDDSEIASLNNVSNNDIKCTINNESNINNDDYQDVILLIKIALHFTIEKFTYIKHFILTDNSTIKCSNKTKISLSDLTFIKYGQTWYERNFNAIPDESNLHIIHNQKLIMYNRLNEKINTNPINFILANKEFLIINNIDQYKIDKILKKIKNIYYENITVYDYLEKFISNHLECLYYIYVFNSYINKLLYETSWIIKKENIEMYNIKYSYLSIDKKATHEKIINRIKNFNKSNLEETRTYNFQKKYKNINYI